MIDISRFSKYNRLISTTARILSVKFKNRNYSLKSIANEITPHAFGDAVLYWTQEAQKEIMHDLKLAVEGKGRYKRLNLRRRGDGLYVVGKRTEVWNEMSYNKTDIPILPEKHRISKLYAEFIHKSSHLGVNADVAKIRTHFWIIAINRIVKIIRYNCIPCRKRNKQLCSQVMSPLPVERLKPAPAWSTIGIVLFGPFHIKGEVNKRSTGKCYGLTFYMSTSQGRAFRNYARLFYGRIFIGLQKIHRDTWLP